MKMLCVSLPLLLLAACQAAPADDATADPIETFSRTIVRGNGPGQPPTVTEELVAASAQPQLLDSACTSADARLFTGANFTGAELCFSGTDDIDLSQYTYFQCSPPPRVGCYRYNWSRAVRSFKTGAYFGALYLPAVPQTLPPQFQCITLLQANSQQATPDSCMPQATRFDDGLNGTPPW